MIFLTLGTQLPFERLVRALDAVAPELDEEVFGQIGRSTYQPQSFEAVDYVPQKAFSESFGRARVIVGHAGMGTILSGLKARKPLVLMARQAALGEHRNDHQRATVKQLGRLPGLHIAEDEADLRRLLTAPELAPMTPSPVPARDRLIETLRDEIFRRS